jgi:hypothetical protein
MVRLGIISRSDAMSQKTKLQRQSINSFKIDAKKHGTAVDSRINKYHEKGNLFVQEQPR